MATVLERNKEVEVKPIGPTFFEDSSGFEDEDIVAHNSSRKVYEEGVANMAAIILSLPKLKPFIKE